MQGTLSDLMTRATAPDAREGLSPALPSVHVLPHSPSPGWPNGSSYQDTNLQTKLCLVPFFAATQTRAYSKLRKSMRGFPEGTAAPKTTCASSAENLASTRQHCLHKLTKPLRSRPRYAPQKRAKVCSMVRLRPRVQPVTSALHMARPSRVGRYPPAVAGLTSTAELSSARGTASSGSAVGRRANGDSIRGTRRAAALIASGATAARPRPSPRRGAGSAAARAARDRDRRRRWERHSFPRQLKATAGSDPERCMTGPLPPTPLQARRTV
mmetsp:Transcript_51512/g.130161  ORF Transcript_51512/g.130161 Transcript_51512/m.130161 type:complete len:269 (+) Transcript_51512:569-1375(+)